MVLKLGECRVTLPTLLYADERRESEKIKNFQKNEPAPLGGPLVTVYTVNLLKTR